MSDAYVFKQGEDFESVYDIDSILIRYYGKDWPENKRIIIIVEEV